MNPTLLSSVIKHSTELESLIDDFPNFQEKLMVFKNHVSELYIESIKNSPVFGKVDIETVAKYRDKVTRRFTHRGNYDAVLKLIGFYDNSNEKYFLKENTNVFKCYDYTDRDYFRNEDVYFNGTLLGSYSRYSGTIDISDDHHNTLVEISLCDDCPLKSKCENARRVREEYDVRESSLRRLIENEMFAFNFSEEVYMGHAYIYHKYRGWRFKDEGFRAFDDGEIDKALFEHLRTLMQTEFLQSDVAKKLRQQIKELHNNFKFI